MVFTVLEMAHVNVLLLLYLHHGVFCPGQHNEANLANRNASMFCSVSPRA